MKDKYFIDTNIFVYSFDRSNPEKSSKAQSIISTSIETGNGFISAQVIQEFINVATKKFSTPMKIKDIKIYMQEVLFPLCSIFPSFDLLVKSLEIHDRYKFSYYDSMIVAAAIQSEASVLLSEDLNSSQKIENITILNPFIS